MAKGSGRKTSSAAARSPVDRELEAGSRAHYEDPTYYAESYRDRVEDVAFYTRLAAERPGPILEYGVGNGRIALPLARQGRDVWGVDHSEAMLEDLRTRLRGEAPEVRKRVHLRRGDMRTARLAKRFSWVFCPFNTALHLYTREDVEAFFARVRAHLAPGGRFVVDLSTPMLEDLVRDPNRAYSLPRFRHPTTGEVVRYREHFDYDRVRQILFVSMIFEPVAKGAEPFTTPLAHRQFFPQEWEALLHYNGFAVESVAGDYEGGPLDRWSEVMVWTARLRPGWSAR